jgi:SpoVK/Ycf46/Vps4 family AAA+-type ATPase
LLVFLGSDLKELCRNAAMIPVREYLRTVNVDVSLMEGQSVSVRPLRTDDFFKGDGDDLQEVYQEGDAEGFMLQENDLD